MIYLLLFLQHDFFRQIFQIIYIYFLSHLNLLISIKFTFYNQWGPQWYPDINIVKNITCFYHMLTELIIYFSCSPKMHLAEKKPNITWHYNNNLKCTDSVLHYNVAGLAVAWMLWMLLPCDWEARKMCLVKVREQGKGQVEKQHVGSMKHTWVSTVKETDRSDRAIFYISSRASSVIITCRPTAN